MEKSIRSVLFAVLFSLVFFMAEGRAGEKPWTEQFQNEIGEIKTRIANLEKQQQDIVAKDNEIIEKLDQLRIWVHRK